MINGFNPDDYLKEHVLKGDTSDGVPNVLSPDNSFVDGIRQKPLSKKKIAAMIDGNFPNDEVKRNYQRNKTLIDLGCVPEELRSEILHIYKEAPENSRSKILNYFIKQRLKTLTESIGEF